jgi:hypothetical protein
MRVALLMRLRRKKMGKVMVIFATAKAEEGMTIVGGLMPRGKGHESIPDSKAHNSGCW